MTYTNSSLVSYTKISPNKTSPRKHKIDTITIHCVVGQCTAESLGDVFANPSRKASSNYGVDKDGRIGLYVEEKDRSWCSSNSANDHRAITIEVASDTTHPYAVTDKALASLIKLVADICKRNGIEKLVWSTDKKDRVNHKNGCNMTVHRDYANKSCPGEYLYNKHFYIAEQVNKKLGIKPNTNKLIVDGSWGKATTKACQKFVGTVQDSIVSGQPVVNKKYLPAVSATSWEFVSEKYSGSNMVRGLQKIIGTEVDGYFGKKSVIALQKYLKEKGYYKGFIDGYCGKQTVKALQSFLNEI